MYFQMFSHIVHGPVPTLDEQKCHDGACRDFVSGCLRKRPQERMSAHQVACHGFIADAAGPTLLAKCLQQFSEIDLRTAAQHAESNGGLTPVNSIQIPSSKHCLSET